MSGSPGDALVLCEFCRSHLAQLAQVAAPIAGPGGTPGEPSQGFLDAHRLKIDKLSILDRNPVAVVAFVNSGSHCW